MANKEISPRALNSPEQYNYVIVRQLVLIALAWGIIGISTGIYLAGELIWPALSFDLPGLTFGRLRPLHTIITIWGFAANLVFASSYYVLQRTCQTRLIGKYSLYLIVWGWQIILLWGILSALAGYTQAREYAELEWPFDIAIEIILGVYLYSYLSTLYRRSQPHIYVANWFYLACATGMILLQTVENLATPVSIFGLKSYSRFAGVHDAMIHWWYGHNLVTFLITLGFLGMMYYFVPKQTGRPLYSYRWSIIHFWSLIFLSVWAASNHLYWTALPDWIMILGVTFSIMLLFPSWAGVANGILTFSGDWNKLRTDPILNFLLFGLISYGLTIFEGGLLSLGSINALAHYTDWIIGHSHFAMMGWATMTGFGVIYHLVPRLWNTKLHSRRLAFIHFWLASAGIILHVGALITAGIIQGQKLRAMDQYGNLLYSFMESDAVINSYYYLRLLGGGLFLFGLFVMLYNLFMTILRGRRAQAILEARIAAKLAVKEWRPL